MGGGRERCLCQIFSFSKPPCLSVSFYPVPAPTTPQAKSVRPFPPPAALDDLKYTVRRDRNSAYGIYDHFCLNKKGSFSLLLLLLSSRFHCTLAHVGRGTSHPLSFLPFAMAERYDAFLSSPHPCCCSCGPMLAEKKERLIERVCLLRGVRGCQNYSRSRFGRPLMALFSVA